MQRFQTPTILLFLALTAAAGCTAGKSDGWRFTKAFNVRKAVGLKKKEALAPIQTPTRIVSTWEEATLRRPGKAPQRGFGGRLLFFNNEGQEAVRVAGQLVVYAYDETQRAAHETQPTRRFVFPAEQFARHESESQLGPSYSVWLPWDAVGGAQKNISLIARFEPKKGALIVGEQTKHLLPGKRMLANHEAAPAAKPIGEIELTQFTQQSKLMRSMTPPQQPLLTTTAPSSKQNARPQAISIALARKNWEQRLKTPHATQRAEPVKVLPGPVRR